MAEVALDSTSGISTAAVQEKPETAETVLQQTGTPGKPDAPEPTDTAEKAKKSRRRRGKKPAADKTVDENVAPADGTESAPVDVAAILKARAAAKKGGRKQSDAQKAALANAKARPAQKKSGPKGRRAAGGPREKKTGKSQNDKCLP